MLKWIRKNILRALGVTQEITALHCVISSQRERLDHLEGLIAEATEGSLRIVNKQGEHHGTQKIHTARPKQRRAASDSETAADGEGYHRADDLRHPVGSLRKAVTGVRKTHSPAVCPEKTNDSAGQIHAIDGAISFQVQAVGAAPGKDDGLTGGRG